MGSIDEMFAQLTLTANPWATTIAGLILIIIITFMAIKVFGQNGVEIGAYGFGIIIFLATILATAIGLLPYYILLIFIIGSVVLIVLSKIFGGNK
jgi:hypothetical protein